MSSDGPNARRRVVGLKRRLSGVAEGTKNYLRGGRAGGEDTTASSAAGEGPGECEVRSDQGGSIRVSDYESLDSSSDAGRPPASSGWLRLWLRQLSNRAANWPQPNMSRRPDAHRDREWRIRMPATSTGPPFGSSNPPPTRHSLILKSACAAGEAESARRLLLPSRVSGDPGPGAR